MNPITTTLNRIRKQGPCKEGWEKLLRHLGKTQADDEPLTYATILESNGLDDALWCCRAEPQHASLWRHCAVDFAETAKHLMTDGRSLNALRVARLHADGLATDDELELARKSASAATADAAHYAAANAAAYYANAAAADVAYATTRSAAYAAAHYAAYAASAAYDAAYAAARDKLAALFLQRVGGVR